MQNEWEKKLAGGFAHMTAPFAEHPSDRERAKDAVSLAREAGITKAQFLTEARTYLEGAQGWPTNIDEQLKSVEKFIGSKLP